MLETKSKISNALFTDSIITCEVKDIISTIENIHCAGKDLKQFIKSYTSFILDLCKFGCTDTLDYGNIPVIYLDRIKRYNDHAFDDFTELLRCLVKLNAEIKWETSPKSSIEATILLFVEDHP